MKIDIKHYDSSLANDWNDFISSSKNGTFLLKRDFMEYHSNRFQDFSLMFYEGDKLVALLPANIIDGTAYSHLGLTYGGLIIGCKGASALVLRLFDELILFLKTQNIQKIIYKPSPHIYHTQPAEEDLYALFRHNAQLTSRSLSSCILLQNRLKYSDLRKRSINKAKKNNIVVEEVNDLSAIWTILEDNLLKTHNTKPVHSIEEITDLKAKFPTEIRAFQSRKEDQILAGVVLFEMQNTVHAQYISANEAGRKIGALDIIFDHLFNLYSAKQYFDFGISTEDGGRYLNEGLINQKEGFGGRGIVYDTYQIDIH